MCLSEFSNCELVALASTLAIAISNEFSKEEEHSTWLYYQKKYSWIQKEWQFVDMSKYNRYECFLIMKFGMFEEILCLIKEHTKKSYFELMVIVAYLSYYSMLGCKNTAT